MNKHLTIVQWNCTSLRGKLTELELLVNDLKPDLILVNESWLSIKDDVALEGYVLFRRDRSFSPYGGSAIFVKSSISIGNVIYSHYTQHGSVGSEWIGVDVLTKWGNLTITTGYRSPDCDFDFTFLDSVFNGTPCLFGGDLNAHLPQFCDPNRAGKELSSWLTSNGHSVVSDGTPTHFSHAGVGRPLDLWLCTGDTADSVTSVGVSEKFGSTHHSIIVRLKCDLLPKPDLDSSKEVRLNFNKVNWNRYREVLDSAINAEVIPLWPHPGDPVMKIDSFAASITKALQKAADDTIPRCEVKKLPKWRLTQQISIALREKSRLQRLRDKQPFDHEIRRAVNRQTQYIKSLVGEQKKKRASSILIKISRGFATHTKSAWRDIGTFLNDKKQRRPIRSLRDPVKLCEVVDEEKQAELLGQTWATVTNGPRITSTDPSDLAFWDEIDHRVAENPDLVVQPNIPSTNLAQLPINTVTKAMKRLKWKAPGHDNISNILIKQGGKNWLVSFADFTF